MIAPAELGGPGDVERALAVARQLVLAGVPLFNAEPDPSKPIGFALPGGWEHTKPSLLVVERWHEGAALCAVMGHTIDLLDLDPRNGQAPELSAWPRAYGLAATPSGGQHAFIAPLRVGSKDGVAPGLDVKSGRPDGGGRGFAFIAPTVRASKVDGVRRRYSWLSVPDLSDLLAGIADQSGQALAGMISASRSGRSLNGHEAHTFGQAGTGANGNAQTSINGHDLFTIPPRTFTRDAAWAFVLPHLHELARARSGSINQTLNIAAKALSHFGPEFWPREQANAWLMDALTHTEYDARTWRAEMTIDSAYGSADRDWRAELHVQGAQFPGAAVLAPPVPAGLNLPEEFWAARPELQQIRQAAHSCGRSGDVAFHAVLARLAGMWPHGVKLDSGVGGSGASANYFAAIVGPSSSGKSTGVSVAKDLLAEPTWTQGGGLADGQPLGSGEGLAEAFMGWEVRPVAVVADPETGDPVQPMGRDGLPKTERVRTQVRHNALFYMDEGEALARMLERTGATIGETLRRAWSGATIGQANGRSETTRIIKEGSYSLGLVIGFQPETCQMLIADGAAGTPQRFLWAWAHDRALPSTRVAYPGALSGVWPVSAPLEWIIGDGHGGSGGSDMGTPVRYAQSIRERLWTQTVARTHGDVTVGELDGHEPLMMVKVSALLAQLAGRREVTEQDWSLAGMVWATSCVVRDYLVAYGRTMAGKAAAASSAAHADREGAAETARLAVRASADTVVIEKAARRMAIRIHEHGVAVARRDAQSAMWIKHRPHFDEAVEHAVSAGWIKVDGADLAPDQSRPV